MKIIPFFRKVTGLEPTTDQKWLLRALTDPKVKKIIISAGRQTGKTLCCAVATIWWSIESGQSVKILLISAQESVLYFHIREIFKNNPELATHIVKEGQYSIVPMRGYETDTGAIVFVRGSTDKQVRGIPADIVIIDEACEIRDDIILTAMGNLTGKISKYVLLSTPHISDSKFVKWASDPKEHGFELFMWNAENCDWHDPEIMKTKKKEFSKQKYAVEVLGRPPTKAERAFFPLIHLKKCRVVDLQPEGGIREGGLDFGDVVGKTMLTITEKLGVRRKVLFQKYYREPIEECLDDIQQDLERFGVVVVKADPKPPEFKAFIKNKIGSVPVEYVDPQYHKKQMLGQLQRHVMRHTLTYDVKMVELNKQLERYRPHKRSGDDRVDSLAFSIYESKAPKKYRVRVFL